MKEIKENTEIAEKDTAIAEKKEADLAVQSEIITQKESEASIAYEAAVPALEAAKLALQEVKQQDIVEMKAVNTPSDAVFLVCQMSYYLYCRSNLGNDDWGNVRL